MKAGIVGLPNVGKSTLFNALTLNEVEANNYAFTTIEPNVANVKLNDKRLETLATLNKTKKIVHATFNFVDIAGLVKGASKGEGLGNKFLANIREVDSIIHVIRCFEDTNIVHVNNKIDPIDDLQTINLELILADLQTIENIINRIAKRAKATNDKTLLKELEIANKLKTLLEAEKSAREIDLSDEEKEIIKSWQLLSLKPIIYVANLKQNDINNLENNIHFNNLKTYLEKTNDILIPICISLEYELSKFEEQEKQEFLKEYGLEYSGLDTLIRKSFYLLDQKIYFTAGEVETRAWVFKNGQNASQCAGIIHTDFEKKFVKAEVISYEDYIACGGEKQAHEAGKMRLEGKNYLMQDGDVCYFKIAK
ncbi:redox-regulated ATPase YchF [Mycoplasma miroungirhinis]|uniref:Ribosome-binding ATPase YchF n=1 Tax=Mycoplasma miroungirhinis TaxID=754516 RepID=A0A6M4JBH8_9MOLU|nr:redox-regulated ATPase YchF [Mycoplasma miroungirhinis]QJR44270.1 redox-regulated ATPase YchF [Mycoplasma miroungirhinis]